VAFQYRDQTRVPGFLSSARAIKIEFFICLLFQVAIMFNTTHHELSEGNLSIGGQHNPDDEKSKITIKFSFESDKTGRTYSVELRDADIESLHPFFINNTSLITEVTGDIPSVVEHDAVVLFYEFKIKSQIWPWKIKLFPETASPADIEIRMLKKKIASLEETIAESATEISNLNEVVKKNTAAIDYLLCVRCGFISSSSAIADIRNMIKDFNTRVYDTGTVYLSELLDRGVDPELIKYHQDPVIFQAIDAVYHSKGDNTQYIELAIRVINRYKEKNIVNKDGKTPIEYINSRLCTLQAQSISAINNGCQHGLINQEYGEPISRLTKLLEEAHRLGFK
jgi:hypothetical protein